MIVSYSWTLDQNYFDAVVVNVSKADARRIVFAMLRALVTRFKESIDRAEESGSERKISLDSLLLDLSPLIVKDLIELDGVLQRLEIIQENLYIELCESFGWIYIRDHSDGFQIEVCEELATLEICRILGLPEDFLTHAYILVSIDDGQTAWISSEKNPNYLLKIALPVKLPRYAKLDFSKVMKYS